MRIIRIEGIGPVYAAKLKNLGIKTTEALLERGADPKGREWLAENADISESLILEWVNRADLMRVRGIGEEYSDLLENAGVDTVKELRNRNPENLHQALLATNQKRRVVRRPPSLPEVKRWVAQAKRLPPAVTY